MPSWSGLWRRLEVRAEWSLSSTCWLGPPVLILSHRFFFGCGFWVPLLKKTTDKNPNPSTGGPRLASNCKKNTWQSSKAIQHGVKLGRIRLLRIGLRGFGLSTISATALITIHACVLAAESNAESGR